jgi:anti-sigma regulatory factor (Ser/Thr protein kinase)
MPAKFELSLTSKIENLKMVSDFITSVAAELELDDRQTFALQVAVDEACCNIIEHAYAERTDGTIHIACQQANDEAVVTIRDHGEPFDPEAVPPADISAPLAKRTGRSLGLYLMHQLMDSVEFGFDAAQGNVLTMRKKRLRK